MYTSPWQLADDEVFQLRGRGGVPFTEFVDALIRAEAHLAGVALGDVRTNIRVNIGDGGVDTEVKVALHGPDFSTPTAWQYKATLFAEVTAEKLEEEVNKPYAKDRILAGSAYRVCVCDDTPAEKREERERALQKAILQINPNAPPPRIVGASDLATWAAKFPAVVARFFRPQLTSGAVSYDQWRKLATADFPHYWAPQVWEEITRAIQVHAAFLAGADPVMTLAGASGVGKSVSGARTPYFRMRA